MSVVVLASGGVDSGVLVHRAHVAGELAGLVWCNYGQPAALLEWRALHKLVAHLGIAAPIHEVPLTTVGAKAMQAKTGEAGPRLVPHRNLIMLAHALNWAEAIGASQVHYGAVRDDAPDYPDCRPRFVLDLNHTLSAWDPPSLTSAWHPQVVAPLIYTRKVDVVAEAAALGILPLCWSCYSPTGRSEPCGTCNSCVSRGAAFPW